MATSHSIKTKVRFKVSENLGGGEIVWPLLMTFQLEDMPTNCGIRVIANIKQEMQFAFRSQKDLPIKIGGRPLQHNNGDYGRWNFNSMGEIAACLTREQRIKALDKQFRLLVGEINNHHIHQFILSDQLRYTKVGQPITKHFVAWLRKNKIGTITTGPITFNGNYTNQAASFVQTWIWIPPSKFTLKAKGNRLVADELKLSRLVIGTIKKDAIKCYGNDIRSIRRYMKDIKFSWSRWKEEQLIICRDVTKGLGG